MMLSATISNNAFRDLKIIIKGSSERRFLSSERTKRRNFNSEFNPGKAAFNITAVPDNSLAEDEYLMGTPEHTISSIRLFMV
jgi:hypothetical protein